MGFAAVASRVWRGLGGLCSNPPACALPMAIAAAALLLRLYGLGDKPFWLDEVASMRRATASLPDLVADSLHNTHYPSYFLLLWLVAKFGTWQWLLRLPSALCGAVAAALSCVIGRRVSGARGGAVAGILMAISPFEVQFGQEARSYTLVSCLILTAIYGLVRLAQEPAAAALPPTRKGGLPRPWIAYALGTAAALDVLNVAIPWLIAANLAAIAIARAAGRARYRFWRNWTLAQLAILLAWAPLLIAVYISRNGAVLDGTEWAPATTTRTIWSILAPVYLLRISSFITFNVLPARVPGLAFAVAAAAAFGAWRLRRDRTVLTVLGCASLVLPLGLGLVALFVPVLVPRYFAWGAGPFFVFAGAGLGQLSARRFALAAAILGTAGLINLVPYYGYETKPRWDLVAKQLAAKARPGDVVLVNDYYAYSVLSVFAARAGFDQHQIKLTWQLSKAEQIPPGGDVWAVYGRTGQAARQLPGEYEKSLASLGHPALERSIGRYIVLWRFAEPKGPDAASLGAVRRDHDDLSMRGDRPR